MIIISFQSVICRGRAIVEAIPLCEKPVLLNIMSQSYLLLLFDGTESTMNRR